MSARKLIAIVTVSIAVCGCYARVPLTVQPPLPQTHLVATLSDSGIVAMSNDIGPGALEIEGIVTSADDDVWTLEMVRVEHRDGRAVMWNHEPVRFQARILTQPQVITLNRKKTWLAAGGITVGAFVLARAFNLIGANDSKDDTPVPQAGIFYGGR